MASGDSKFDDLSEADIDSLIDDAVPKNTKKATAWGISVLKDFPAKTKGERTELNMPHLKVNVNGKRYTISGLTRRTCSKQILCALAKVDAELRASTAFTEKVNSETDLNDSPNENRGERTEQAAHKTKRRSKGEDKLNNCDGREGKTKYGKEHTNREARSFKRTSGMDSKGSQTSNGMLETLRQDCRLATHNGERDVKLEVRPKTICSDMSKNEDTKNIGNINAANAAQRETIAGGNPKDTDQDTGISELYSDSSFENNQLLKTRGYK